MRRLIAAAAAAFLWLVSASAAWADATSQLQAARTDITQAWERARNYDLSVAENVSNDVASLTTLIDNDALTGDPRLAAFYYRGWGRQLINSIRVKKGSKLDADVAHATLSDFDTVIAGNRDLPTWDVTIANTEYLAGGIAKNSLDDTPGAYAYWIKCAARNHAGCMNIIAVASITGEDGQPVDYKQALDLHTRVFNTGTNFSCAGVYSAEGIAAIVYFTGTKRPGDDEIQWVTKAYPLLDRLAAQQKNKNACNRATFEFDEFLYRLSRGDRQEALLHKVIALIPPDDDDDRAFAGYMLGTVSEDDMQATFAAVKSERARCTDYFYALWYDELTDKPDLARANYDRMVAIGQVPCHDVWVYVKKYF